MTRQAGRSLRRQLLLGILGPVIAFMLLNAFTLYRQALSAADTAYDRTLLASAKVIGELLELGDDAGTAKLKSTVLYSALEAFEADNRSRMFYKVTGFAGEMVSGFGDLPPWRGELPAKNTYAALVHFYDDNYRGVPVRMAVLLQPVAGQSGQGMATIQVAETLELRQALARQLLVQTAWQQAAFVAVMALAVVLVVQRATGPVRALNTDLQLRRQDDLSPLPLQAAPRELQPLIAGTNAVMAKLAQLLEHQKRFVRDAAHQLRTPLAVLKTQVQSAQRGDVEPQQALREIGHTVSGATALANQMLALARAEQLRAQWSLGSDVLTVDWADTLRSVALDLAPLIADAQLEFALSVMPAPMRAHEWALRELTRNLLHNALKHSPAGAALSVTLQVEGWQAVLTVADGGPGIAQELRPRLFQPFSRGAAEGTEGSGLGLAICREIVLSLGGSVHLHNRLQGGRVAGLDAVVHLPMQTPDPT